MLALFSAVTFASSQVLIRLGMQTATPVATAFIINGVVSVCGLAVSLYRGTLLDSGWIPLFWFAATGMVGPGVGRLAYFIGITRMMRRHFDDTIRGITSDDGYPTVMG